MIITSKKAGQPGGEWRLAGFLVGGAGVVAVGWGVGLVLESTSCDTGGGFPWLSDCTGLPTTGVGAIVAGVIAAIAGMWIAGLLRYVPAFLMIGAGAGAALVALIGDPEAGRGITLAVGIGVVVLAAIPLWLANRGDAGAGA